MLLICIFLGVSFKRKSSWLSVSLASPRFRNVSANHAAHRLGILRLGSHFRDFWTFINHAHGVAVGASSNWMNSFIIGQATSVYIRETWIQDFCHFGAWLLTAVFSCFYLFLRRNNEHWRRWMSYLDLLAWPKL